MAAAARTIGGRNNDRRREETTMRSLKTLTSDLDLRDTVEAELGWDPKVDATRIHVAVEDGSVTLTGSVPSFAQKSAAVRRAESVEGVKAIADDLAVRPPSAEKKDAAIAREIAREREWSTSIPESVDVEVSKGHVTLRGAVESSDGRDEAVRAVRHLKGVRGVTSLITIEPKPEPDASGGRPRRRAVT
jgi:osmotically-inducible protein OsmY